MRELVTWKSVEGREPHRLAEEGVLGVVEAEGLVDDVGLRLHTQTQQGHGLAVLRQELHLQAGRGHHLCTTLTQPSHRGQDLCMTLTHPQGA